MGLIRIFQSPNLVGSPLGVVQLVLYCKFRKNEIVEEPKKRDLEKDGEILKQQALPVNDKINGNN